MNLQLKELRKKAGYSSREDFAHAMGISPATYKSWETEARKIKLVEACKIADFLNVSLDELAGRWEYVGSYSDARQEQMNDTYGRLTEENKDAALGAVLGVASMQARKKAGSEGPQAEDRKTA